MGYSAFVHPDFKLNGLAYTSPKELLGFADQLLEHGAVHEVSLAEFLHDWFSANDDLVVSTSGSTGDPKPICLSKIAMTHSAKTTGEALELEPRTEALLCLSCDYIAGKMMVVRALTLGWHLHVVAPSLEALTEYDSSYDFVAMIPAQAMHSLPAMDKVKILLIGGGAVSPKLEAALQNAETQAYVSYGMTETISHIALRRINGSKASSSYTAVAGVSFSKDDRDCLVVNAPALSEQPLITNDLVKLISQTQFEWLGRADNVINSGGVKVYPEALEAQLSDTINAPFFIASEPDDVLGERVILVVESPTRDGHATGIHKGLFNDLPKYAKPKKIYGISRFLYTETGKIRRTEILSLLQDYQASR